MELVKHGGVLAVPLFVVCLIKNKIAITSPPIRHVRRSTIIILLSKDDNYGFEATTCIVGKCRITYDFF